MCREHGGKFATMLGSLCPVAGLLATCRQICLEVRLRRGLDANSIFYQTKPIPKTDTCEAGERWLRPG